jgi:hypothetical protein
MPKSVITSSLSATGISAWTARTHSGTHGVQPHRDAEGQLGQAERQDAEPERVTLTAPITGAVLMSGTVFLLRPSPGHPTSLIRDHGKIGTKPHSSPLFLKRVGCTDLPVPGIPRSPVGVLSALLLGGILVSPVIMAKTEKPPHAPGTILSRNLPSFKRFPGEISLADNGVSPIGKPRKVNRGIFL